MDFPEVHSPLTEIFWESLEVEPPVDLLFTVFEGQNIRTFSLDGIPSVDADFISRLAQAFPLLQKLTLITQDDRGSDDEWDTSVRLPHVYKGLINNHL